MKVTKLIVFSLILTGIGLSYAGDAKLSKSVASRVRPPLPPSPMATPVLGAASAPAGPLSENVMDSLFGDGHISAPVSMPVAPQPSAAPVEEAVLGADDNDYMENWSQYISYDDYLQRKAARRAEIESELASKGDADEAEPVATGTTGLNFGGPAGRYSEAPRLAPRSAMDLFGDDPTDEEALVLLGTRAREGFMDDRDDDDAEEEPAAPSSFGLESAGAANVDPDLFNIDFEGFEPDNGVATWLASDVFADSASPAVASFDEAGFSLGAPDSGYREAAVGDVDLLGLGSPVGLVVEPVVVPAAYDPFDVSGYVSTGAAGLGSEAYDSTRSTVGGSLPLIDLASLYAAKEVLPAVSTSGLHADRVDFSADMGGSAEDDPFAALLTEPVVVPTLSDDDAQNLPKLEEYLIKQKAFDYARVIDTSLADKLSAAGSSVSSPSVASRVESRSVSPLSAGSLDSTDVDGEAPSKEALAGGSILVPAVKTISESDIDFGNVVSVERALVDGVGLRYNDVVNENFTDKVEALRDYIQTQ
jgi:hypothetical protein